VVIQIDSKNIEETNGGVTYLFYVSGHNQDISKPKYFTTLTADIRYHKGLTANEKILYSEIVVLSKKEGYCWASNRFLARLYGVTPETVSKWISNLKRENLIRIEIDKSAGNRRKLWIVDPIKNNTDTSSEENYG
jgi:helix-turn-helix protein